MRDLIKLALVEDDFDDAKDIINSLRSAHYEVVHYFDVNSAVTGIIKNHKAESDKFSILITDCQLRPDLYGGFTVVKKIRENDVNIPIIMTTSILDAVLIRDFTLAAIPGIVDYFEKSSIGSTDSFKRIDNMVKMYENVYKKELNSKEQSDITNMSDITGAGPVRFDVACTFWKESEVRLTITQMKLAYMLAKNNGALVLFDDLYECVISGRKPDNINNHVNSVNDAFFKVDSTFNCLKKVAFHGWKWIYE